MKFTGQLPFRSSNFIKQSHHRFCLAEKISDIVFIGLKVNRISIYLNARLCQIMCDSPIWGNLLVWHLFCPDLGRGGEGR